MHPLVSPGAGPIPGVPFHQPSNLFRFGEITLYSTFCFPATTALANTSNRCFSTPLGQGGQGYPAGITLTVGETNLKEAGRIPSGQAYDVFGVAGQVMAFDSTALNNTQDVAFNVSGASGGAFVGLVNDLQNVVNNAILIWDFTQTNVFICPLMLAGAGGGVFGAVSTNAAAVASGSMGNGNGGIWMYRKHPVALPGNSTFAVLIDFGGRAGPVGAIPAGVAIRVVLLGYYKSVIELGN